MLTETDEIVLEELHTHPKLTLHQLCNLLEKAELPTLGLVYPSLTKLREKGYVREIYAYPENLWEITKDGQEALLGEEYNKWSDELF